MRSFSLHLWKHTYDAKLLCRDVPLDVSDVTVHFYYCLLLIIITVHIQHDNKYAFRCGFFKTLLCHREILLDRYWICSALPR